jgi:hypothetical protein
VRAPRSEERLTAFTPKVLRHVTVARDGGHLPHPAEFAMADERSAAAARTVSIVTAYTAWQIISVVTVHAADQPAAVAIAPAVLSEALSLDPPA